MLGVYCSTDKIIRIMFIVTVSVIHCWLCSSTNHNSACCHLTRPPSVYRVNGSIEGCLMTYIQRHTIYRANVDLTSATLYECYSWWQADRTWRLLQTNNYHVHVNSTVWGADQVLDNIWQYLHFFACLCDRRPHQNLRLFVVSLLK